MGSFTAVLLKLSDVAHRQFFFQCSRDRQAKQAGPLLLFLSFLENISVPADDGPRTTLWVALIYSIKIKLYGFDLIDIQFKNWFEKLIFILYKTHETI